MTLLLIKGNRDKLKEIQKEAEVEEEDEEEAEEGGEEEQEEGEEGDGKVATSFLAVSHGNL